MPDWITPEDVAAWLDLPTVDPADDNLLLSTAAIKAAVERRRSDLFDDGGVFVAPDDVRTGSILWASILYQARSAPSGFAGYGDEASTIFDPLGSRRAEVLRLIGWRRPTAA
jgi:hypothetical protein